VAAELAEREDRKALRISAGNALSDGSCQRPIDRFVGEIRQGRGYALEVELAGQVAKRHGQGERGPASAQLGAHIVGLNRQRSGDRLVCALASKGRGDVRK
jgi:hypothetical protein